MIRRMKTPNPGPLGARFIAMVIDAFILVPFMSLLQHLLQDSAVLAAAAGLILNLGYYVFFLSGNWQATPGKRIMGVFVTDINGQRLNREGAALHYIAFILPQLPLYMSISDMAVMSLILWLHLIWFLPMLLTSTKRGVHDFLAYTQSWEGRI
jgi:uncharacterized RDD family membrane protein YckC